MTRTLLATGITSLLVACADVPQMSRDEYLATTTRTYAGASKEQVIAAAERVLRVTIDETGVRGFKFAHSDEGFLASKYMQRLGGGMEYWDVRVRESPQGARVSLQVNAAPGNIAFVPTTTAGTYGAAPNQGPSRPVEGSALYDLFFARLSYMLWQTDAWMTCADSKARIDARIVTGSNSLICDVSDDVPGKPRDLKLTPQQMAARGSETTTMQVTPDRVR